MRTLLKLFLVSPLWVKQVFFLYLGVCAVYSAVVVGSNPQLMSEPTQPVPTETTPRTNCPLGEYKFARGEYGVYGKADGKQMLIVVTGANGKSNMLNTACTGFTYEDKAGNRVIFHGDTFSF